VLWTQIKSAAMIVASASLEAVVGLKQFMRIDTFAHSPRQVDGKRATVSEVLGEMAHASVAVSEGAKDEPAELVQGAAPQSLAPEAERLATTAVNSAGQKLHGDAAILVAGVASFPVEPRIFERDVIEQEVYGFWRVRVVSWLHDTFGLSLKCVVERQDEHYRRLHFFALPSLTNDLRLDWRRAHPGLAAKQRAEQAGANKQEQEREYWSAMRRMNGQFYERVIKDLGPRFGDANLEKPARKKTKRLESQASERERRLEATVEKVSAELETEREQSRTRQTQLDQALKRLAAAERRAR